MDTNRGKSCRGFASMSRVHLFSPLPMTGASRFDQLKALSLPKGASPASASPDRLDRFAV